MSSSDPQLPVESGGSKPPSTREIPVVQPAAGATATQHLPPHPGATTPAPVEPVEAHVPTGPVDFVPGLPGLGTPPPPPPVRPTPSGGAPSGTPDTAPAAATSVQAPAATWPETLETETASGDRPRTTRIRAPRDRATLLGIGLTVLSVVLLELGLAMRWDELESYWLGIPLWSAFATLCALLGLVAFAASAVAGDRVRSGPAWRVAAAGLVGLAVFWLLVVLPVVATDRGFVLTAALAALGGALWVGPRQKG